MPDKPISIDEYAAKRKNIVNDDGIVYKGVIAEDKAFDAESRSGKFVMSTESPDRDRDVIKQDGLDLTNFLKLPMALAYHRHSDPIGMWEDVKTITNGRPRRTEGVLKLHPEGTTASVDEIGRLLAVGGLKACSIGFRPKEIDYIRDDNGVWTGGFFIPESELYECSVVSIPANPEALAKDCAGNMKLFTEALEYILDTYTEKTDGGLIVRKNYVEAWKKAKESPAPTVTDTVHVNIDGLAESVFQKIMSAFTVKKKDIVEEKEDDFSEYMEESITLTEAQDDDGVKTVDIVGEWPEKTSITDEFVYGELATIDGELITISLASQYAEYKIVGRDERKSLIFVEFVKSEAVETEKSEDVKYVEGSRARAIVKREKLLASMRESGALQ